MPTPLFTKANAAEMARRATRSRIQRIAREKAQREAERAEFAKPPTNASEDQRRGRVQKQIERCDELLESCRDPETFVKLTAAKERLWSLIYSKPGNAKPKKGGSRETLPPVAPIVPLVAPITDENHNAKTDGDNHQ